MTSAVDIANRALSAIAAKSTIANIAVEQSAEAKQVRLLYAPTRDALLRAAHWGFAKKTAYLSLLKSAPGTPENSTSASVWSPATMPAPPWLYSYAYPSDCMLLRSVAPSSDVAGSISPPLFSVALPGPVPALAAAVRFEKATDTDTSGNLVTVVLTNARRAVGTYTARVEPEHLWDAAFAEAMVAALAARLALALTGNREMAQVQANQAMQALRIAQASNGNEGTTTVDHVPDWIRARGYAAADPITGYMEPWVMPAFLVF